VKRALIFPSILVVLGALLTGCGKSSVNAPVSNSSFRTAAQARMAGIMASAPQVVEDGQFESGETATLGSGRPGAFAAITPLHFWRHITHVDRSFEFAFSDTDSTGKPTKAMVTVNKVLTGTFNIATASETTPDSVVVVQKALEDHWERKLMFVRIPHEHDGDDDGEGDHMVGSTMAMHDTSDDHEGDDEDEDWRLVGTSGVQVTSKDAVTKIVSLRLQATGIDTTVTDPLGLFRLRGVPQLDFSTPLTLTVTTQHNDDVVVLLLRHHRVQFTNNGDNTYSWTLDLPSEEDMPTLRHIGVNAFSHGTLFDDQLPYDSQAWIVPFMIKPNMMAEDLH